MKALVLAIVIASELGFRVTPPAGWTEDAEQSEQLREATKDSFFAGVRPHVDATVFRGPDATLIVQVLEIPADSKVDMIDAWAKRLPADARTTRRSVGSTRVLDAESELGDLRTQSTFHVVTDESGVGHAIAAVCTENKASGTACAAAIESVGIGAPPEEGNSGWYWVAIAGAFLVSIGLVGWRIELRRRR